MWYVRIHQRSSFFRKIIRFFLEMIMISVIFGFILSMAVADVLLSRIVSLNHGDIGTYFLRLYMWFYFGLGNSLIVFSVLIYTRVLLR